MAFNFPSSPSEGQRFAPPSGPTYGYTSPYWLVVAPDVAAPVVVSFSPTDNATDAPLMGPFRVTFNELVLLGTGNVTLKKTSDNSTIETWDVSTEIGSGAGQASVSGTVLTLRLSANLVVNTEYYIIWDAGVVVDGSGNPVAAQSSTTAWSFVTALTLDLTSPDTATLLTCVRASDAWADNLAGVWSKFASNIPRITDKGLLLEPQRINACRYSRDQTNAQWVKASMTAVKDQTGVDGVANSCCRLTATANGATITNTCSIASAARVASMFVKRLAGSGTVELSVHGVSNVQVVTVTTSWTRVLAGPITITNPQFYIRLGTSGDSIAVDFCQTEANFTGAPGSPIETAASTTTTRPQDTVTFINPSIYGVPGGPTLTMFVQCVPTVPITYGTAQDPVSWDDGTVSNRVILRRTLTTGIPQAFNTVATANAGFSATAIGTAMADGVRHKMAISVSTGAQSACVNGGSGATATSGLVQVALGTLRIGNAAADTTPWNGWVERVTLYNTFKTLAELQTMTT